MKVDWALGGTVGLRNPAHFHAIENSLDAPGRFFDQWGTQILAGLAIVILLGLVYPWGNKRILLPLLLTLAWAGSLIAVVGLSVHREAGPLRSESPALSSSTENTPAG
jgi:hypothetical protein